jgi:hypothetical protein
MSQAWQNQSKTQARPGTKASGLVGCVGLRLASRVIFGPHLRSIVLGTSLPDTKASRLCWPQARMGSCLGLASGPLCATAQPIRSGPARPNGQPDLVWSDPSIKMLYNIFIIFFNVKSYFLV